MVNFIPGQTDPDKPAAIVTVSGTVQIGQLLQMLTVLGSVIASIFSAGSYVQSIRDDLRAGQTDRANDDRRLADLLKQLTSQVAATGSQANDNAVKAAAAAADTLVKKLPQAIAGAAAEAAQAAPQATPQAPLQGGAHGP